MTPSVLDYHSDCPTFSLAFSPLSTSTSNLKLAVGSYNESRSPTTTSITSSSSPSAPDEINNITIISLDPTYLEFDDAHSTSSTSEVSDQVMESYIRSSKNGALIPSTGSAFFQSARASMPYPASSIAFSPARLSSSLQSSSVGTAGEATREMVASSSECLRLWDLVQSDSAAGVGKGGAPSGGFVGRHSASGTGTRLVQRAMLANSKQEYSAPLTSFSWSTLEPTHIVTSSIDTTCTVWDISTGVPVTQLIAHDREVYDVAWSPASRDVFASVGADGSVRMFDLRSLEHSTILYEATSPSPSGSSKNGTSNSSHGNRSPPHSSSGGSKTPLPPSPLLRLAFSPSNPSYLSIVHADSSHVQILDTRSPGVPVMEVRGHHASVNGMAWGGGTMSNGSGGSGETSGPGWLATCSDDSTLLLWDLSAPPIPNSTSTSSGSRSSAVLTQPKVISTPTLSYSAPSEINAVAWGGGGEWVATGCRKTVRCLRV